VLQNARDSYSAGRASLLEVIDAQRTLLDVRRGIAEARIERELRLAAIEELGGFDVETLGTKAEPLEDSDVRSQE
jgi:outer membrane protein TolC